MWTHNIQTHPPTSPTQHTNTPTDPPKTKTFITHKHNTQPTNTQHGTHNTNIVAVVQQDPKYIYIVMSVGVSHTHWTAKLF